MSNSDNKPYTKNIVAIIQARTGSSRLPGKVLADLGGKTVLERVLRRLCRSALIARCVVATSTQPGDDAIVRICNRQSVLVFRGHETDVLDRFYRAATCHHAELVLRITSDCPLIDAGVTDKVIAEFLQHRPDYASNVLKRTYPRGLDTEVMNFSTLQRAWREANECYQRSHVTPYVYQNPHRFNLLSVQSEQDYSRHRWTIDTRADLQFLRAIYERMNNRDDFCWNEVLGLVEEEPELAVINQGIFQKNLYEG